jgi:hypothetical protein
MTTGSGKSVADTPFEEALADFKEFLSSQGLSTKVIWVFREDVVFQPERIFIKLPIPTENESRAQACYELAQRRNFGVSLRAFCLLETHPCCYIVLPENDGDAGRMLMSKAAVKCVAVTNLIEAEPVLNPAKWLTLRLLNRKSHVGGFDEYIPSKYNLLPDYAGGAG